MARNLKKKPVKTVSADVIESVEQHKESKKTWAKTINQKWLTDKTYEYDDTFHVNTSPGFWEARTMGDIVHVMENNKNVQIDARVIASDPKTKHIQMKSLSRDKFLEAAKSRRSMKLREADYFADSVQSGFSGYNAGNVGDDFVPLLGGPFNKQLYLYDYQRMHSLGFYAYHHDPIARFAINTITDFALGRGVRVDVTGGKHKNAAQAIWDAFEEVNDLHNFLENCSNELGIYGELMTWKLPGQQTYIGYQDLEGQEPPKGVIPRYRLIDPSAIWEIVTFPEDITRVLYYQWIAPTQYQIYGGTAAGKPVSTLKYIYQQIPADQVHHYKINCVSNEKRGRSDLFPVLGYLKRMRDAVNYQLIGDMKTSAWSIDTTIDGDQDDIDNYVANQAAMGTVPPAGSEFVHTKAIERQYLANQGTKMGASNSFEWNLSMIAIGLGIPVSYFGSHLSGGQTRASALVSTEPFSKRIEKRQEILKRIVEDMFDDTMRMMGLEATCEVTMPEVVVQDRTAKLKDLALAEAQKWISKERAANIASKELGVKDYDYGQERMDMKKQGEDNALSQAAFNPLTAPPQANGLDADKQQQIDPSAIDGQDRRRARLGRGF